MGPRKGGERKKGKKGGGGRESGKMKNFSSHSLGRESKKRRGEKEKEGGASREKEIETQQQTPLNYFLPYR